MVARISQDLGAYSLANGGKLEFSVPNAAAKAPAKGDLLVVLIAGQGLTPSPTTGPTGWVRHVDEDASGGESRHAELWSKTADGAEGGTTMIFPSGGNLLAGVLVVYRALPVVPPQASDVDSVKCQRTVGVTNHAMVASEGTQAEDRRLLLWWIQDVIVTIAEAVNALFTSFGKELDANTGWVTAGEYLANAIGAAPSGALVVTSSAVANGVVVAVTLRVRVVARPDGTSDPIPGAVGLTL